MTATSTELESRLARFVEHHVLHGERLNVTALCEGRPDLIEPLGALVERYLSITASLDGGSDAAPAAGAPLPHFEGFQTIERIGAGGMGEVYKLRDLRLNRTVAAKVMREGPHVRVSARSAEDFLREARALALFSDRRIVQVFEVRLAAPKREREGGLAAPKREDGGEVDSDPAVIIMEFVDGFELGRIGPSLDFAQRGRTMAEICEAVQHAHDVGVQHRDLKPSNIMLDAQLTPRILDFGLSGGDPQHGHLKGSLPYVAPEQLDPAQPIDARTDVYALGVIFYELLCGRPPYSGVDTAALIGAIREGHPRLPVEIDSRVPEPLQAIALSAMETDPARRYQTALEMAADIRRFLEGRPVLARPSIYTSTLETRTRPHLSQIDEWLRLRLIYPHEAERLRNAYRALDAPEDDWIVESRTMSYPQIALYLGAFLLVCGSLFYFAADRWYEAVHGIAGPFAVLGLPFIGLNAAAHVLYRRDQKGVAVAFYLAAVGLLPLFLLIAFHETGFLVVPAGAAGQLFQDGSISNRQLQLTTGVATLWCGWLALRTRTAALSTVFTFLVFLLAIAFAADFGLRTWLEESRWDRLALSFFPLIAAYAALGAAAERKARDWLSRPSYIGAALLMMIALELLALDGRALHYLGMSLQALQATTVSNRLLLDTLAAMTANGALFYAAAAALERWGSAHMQVAARLLFSIAPFALLHPLGYLVRTAEYSLRFDWIYAGCAGAIVMLSHRRQRRAFYYAGLLNLGIALFFIASHRHWFERPAWAVAVITAGLAALAAGFALDRAARLRR